MMERSEMTEKAKRKEDSNFGPRIVKKVMKNLQEKGMGTPIHSFDLQEKEPAPRLFKGACGCGGDIVEDIEIEFYVRSGPNVYGPASEQPYHYVSEGFHCKKCGLMYKFVPEGKEQKKKDKTMPVKKERSWRVDAIGTEADPLEKESCSTQ
jgi:hypothetical protein